jgi:F-type H+-transporting ATPase subunit c
LWSFFGIAIACGFGIGLAAMGTGVGGGIAINGLFRAPRETRRPAGRS